MTGFGNIEVTHAGKLLSLLKSATPGHGGAVSAAFL
jgi:hypothetical protein